MKSESVYIYTAGQTCKTLSTVSKQLSERTILSVVTYIQYMYMYMCCGFESHPRQLIFHFGKVTALGVLCFFALLFVWPCLLLSSFFVISH